MDAGNASSDGPHSFGHLHRFLHLEQAIYLSATTDLVPKWLPLSQMFWSLTTTVLFALAAVALLTNRLTLLATCLLTMMLVVFGLLVWVPLLLSDPHSYANWSETIETFAIAGTAGFSLISSASRLRSAPHKRRA